MGAGAPDLDAYDSSEESSFYNRTPEEYRDAILKATNKAQIDAFICQQLVQEMREQGADYTDEEFYDILAEEEYRLERQRRVEFWVDEQQRLKERWKQTTKSSASRSVLLSRFCCSLHLSEKRNPEQEIKKGRMQEIARFTPLQKTIRLIMGQNIFAWGGPGSCRAERRYI